ncbi:hypothetical protein HK099_001788, partial [Clydaea vesicula]
MQDTNTEKEESLSSPIKKNSFFSSSEELEAISSDEEGIEGDDEIYSSKVTKRSPKRTHFKHHEEKKSNSAVPSDLKVNEDSFQKKFINLFLLPFCQGVFYGLGEGVARKTLHNYWDLRYSTRSEVVLASCSSIFFSKFLSLNDTFSNFSNK